MIRIKTCLIGIGLSCAVVFLAIFVVSPTFGKSSANNIVVTDADTIRTLSSNQSLALNTALDGVKKRFVVRFANTKKIVEFAQVPSALEIALDAVAKRAVIRFANSKRVITLSSIPAVFDGHLSGIEDRAIVRFANSMRQTSLVFPIGMIPDEVSPQISPPTSIMRVDTISINWTTDEIASSLFAYGLQSGSYPKVLAPTELGQVHGVKIPGLSPATYHYRISAEDRSNNQSEVTGTFVITAATPVPTSTALPTATTVPLTATPTSPSEPGGSEDLIYLPLMQR